MTSEYTKGYEDGMRDGYEEGWREAHELACGAAMQSALEARAWLDTAVRVLRSRLVEASGCEDVPHVEGVTDTEDET